MTFQVTYKHPVHDDRDAICGWAKYPLPNVYETRLLALKIAYRANIRSEDCGGDGYYEVVDAKTGRIVDWPRLERPAIDDTVPF